MDEGDARREAVNAFLPLGAVGGPVQVEGYVSACAADSKGGSHWI